MKKTSTFQQKLKSYSAVAGAVVAGAAATDAKAQIVYTDVNPDVTLTADSLGQGYNLDLDNNSVVDFVLAAVSGTVQGYPFNYLFAYSATPTTNQIDTIAGSSYPAAHNLNDNIGSANMWSIGYGSNYTHGLAVSLPTLGFTSGNFIGVNDKYLAVKFDISGTTHYGWVRLSASADASTLTIKDYAYNSQANGSILAGQTVGIANITLEGVKVFSYNKQVNIDLGKVKDANITIHDVMGREVSTMNLGGGSTMLDLSNEASGIYTVSIMTAEGRSVTKVAIK